MQYSLSQICERVGVSFDNGPDVNIHGVNSLHAADEGELTFAQSERQSSQAAQARAAAVIVGEAFPNLPGKRLLRTENPRLVFAYVAELFVAQEAGSGTHAAASIDPAATLGAKVSVGACAVIGPGAEIGNRTRIASGAYIGPGVQIGADCRIGPNVSLLPGVVVGKRCILHAGVTLGGDGFGFVWAGDHHHKMPQLGRLVLEEDVEVGCNACVDRATLGETRIRRGTKIDNLVQVAHNVDVGEHVILVSQVGIAGSVTIGGGAVLGGQVGVADHVNIGAGAQIMAQSGIPADVDAKAPLFGSPARPARQAFREIAALTRLPELLKTVKYQEKRLSELQSRLDQLEAARKSRE